MGNGAVATMVHKLDFRIILNEFICARILKRTEERFGEHVFTVLKEFYFRSRI
jgi:hypothetical protein